MNALAERYERDGASLNTDGIPLHFGDLVGEYAHLERGAVLLDRSHEGRVRLSGDSRFDLVNRLSTNKTLDLAPLQGVATLFTNANARIIDRVETYHLPDGLWLLTSPGRGEQVRAHLGRNIFFNDKASVSDETANTCQFDLHGAGADACVARLTANPPARYHAQQLTLNGVSAWLFHRKPLLGGHWTLVCDRAQAHLLYDALRQDDTLRPSGSLLFNALRIRTGTAGVPELSQEFIPLELGLWDEVSFHKGCYTGQEIIARMDSRERLARVMVALDLESFAASPQPLFSEQKPIGQMTSSVTAPDGKLHAIAIIKTSHAQAGHVVEVGAPTLTHARVLRLLGKQPDWVSAG